MSFVQEHKILGIECFIGNFIKQAINQVLKDPMVGRDKAGHNYDYCMLYMSVHTTCGNKNIVFHFRFDFTVVVTTFIVQLFEIDIPFLTFMIPFRFLRSVYNISMYIYYITLYV